MRPPRILPTLIALSMSATSACSKPEIGAQINVCLDAGRWPEVEAMMRKFGERHELKFHGEIEPLSTANPSAHLHNQMNFALIRGLHQLGGDDFDLWVTSDPSEPSHAFVSVITRKHITLEEQQTANAFVAELNAFACEAQVSPTATLGS